MYHYLFVFCCCILEKSAYCIAILENMWYYQCGIRYNGVYMMLGDIMKLFGLDIVQQNLGYFGVRRCSECGGLKDVDYVKIRAVFRLFGIPIPLQTLKRFLVCSKCGAAFDISDELWEYYKSYYNKRFSKSKTDELISILIKVDANIADNSVDYSARGYNSILDMIYESLIKKFPNSKNLEEVISVYFS